VRRKGASPSLWLTEKARKRVVSLRRRRYRSQEAEVRAYYRHVCKIGWYEPMQKIPAKNFTGWCFAAEGDFVYLRPACQGYRNGYPVHHSRSGNSRVTLIESAWIAQSEEAWAKRFVKKFHERAEEYDRQLKRYDKRGRIIELLIKKRWRRYGASFRANFRGTEINIEELPNAVLQLAEELTALRTAIRKVTKKPERKQIV